MGFRRAVAAIAVLTFCAGCQMPQPGLGTKFAAHVARVNPSGLVPAEKYTELNIEMELPHHWEAMATQSGAIYTHQQWRSPDHDAGVGVAYIHMPLPMSAKALIWIARSRYSKQNEKDHKADPSLQGEWTDWLGREWLEGESEKYHVKGYVVVSGFDAWVVYGGYRIKTPPSAHELSLAMRSMESVVPLPLKKQSEQPGLSIGGGW